MIVLELIAVLGLLTVLLLIFPIVLVAGTPGSENGGTWPLLIVGKGLLLLNGGSIIWCLYRLCTMW